MSDQLEQEPNFSSALTLEEEKPVDDAPSHSPRSINLPMIIAGIALLATVGGWLYGQQQHSLLREQLSRKLGEIDSFNKESRAISEKSLQSAQTLQTQLAVLENKYNDSRNQQLALEALYQELARNRDDSLLAEIEQMLAIASQQLQLAHNISAALITLQATEQRLQRADNPQLIALRKAVNHDLARLRAMPYLDAVGISLRLDNLVAEADNLPLIVDARPLANKTHRPKDQPQPNLVLRLAGEVWQDMKQMIQIRRIDQPEVILLSPEQAFFLRENLKLRLLSARMALLQRDEDAFKTDLNAAQATLKRYFDIKARPTLSALNSLKQLAESKINIELPEINTSLNAIRDLKLARERINR